MNDKPVRYFTCFRRCVQWIRNISVPSDVSRICRSSVVHSSVPLRLKYHSVANLRAMSLPLHLPINILLPVYCIRKHELISVMFFFIYNCGSSYFDTVNLCVKIKTKIYRGTKTVLCIKC